MSVSPVGIIQLETNVVTYPTDGVHLRLFQEELAQRLANLARSMGDKAVRLTPDLTNNQALDLQRYESELNALLTWLSTVADAVIQARY